MKKTTIKRIISIMLLAFMIIPIISTSIMADTDFEIISQPTNENPTVVTNNDDYISRYDWYYTYIYGEYEVISSNGIFGDKIELDFLYNGEFKDGKWISDSGYINIAIHLIPGDILKITVDDDFTGYVGEYDSFAPFDASEDGSYTYTAESVINMDFKIEKDYEDRVEAEIQVIREGKAYTVSTEEDELDKENKKYYTPDVDEGYYEDSKWISEYEDANSLYEIDVELELEDAGNIIEVVVEDDFDGKVIVSYDADGELIEIELKIENNKATYTTDGIIVDFEIIIKGEDEHTANIYITNDNVKYEVVKNYGYNDENMTLDNVYINDGYYSNGVWTPGGYDENEIDIELELYAGSEIIIKVSDGFNGTVCLTDISDDIELEGKDGVYRYFTKKYIAPDVEITSDNDDFTAQIYIVRGKQEHLENQTTSTVALNAVGKYYVEVSFINGLRLTSNVFTVDDCVSFDTNGGTPLKVAVGKELTQISGTTKREGFIFEGWYLDKELKNKVSLPLNVNGLVTIYAKWIKCNHLDSEEKPSCQQGVECTVCKAEYEATGHSFNLEYTQKENNHYYECSQCGAKKSEGEHTFSQWITKKHPERKEQGSMERVCTACLYTETKAIDELGGISNGGIVGIILGSSGFLSLTAIGIWFVLKRRI